MKPLSVEISGFRAWGKGPTTVSFPEGVIALTGDNEVGKTSLIESIMWCLYGGAAMREKQEGLIHEGLRDMSVAYEFELDGVPIEVARRYTLSGRTALTLLFHEGPDAGADMTQATVRETEVEIQKLVGPYEVASRSWYSPQERGKLFFEANPAERRDVFGQALAIPESWATWHNKAKAQLAKYQRTAETDGLRLQDFGEPKDIDGFDKAIKAAQKQGREATDERDRLEAEWLRLDGAYIALNAVNDSRHKMVTELFSEAMEEWATKASDIDQDNDQAWADYAGVRQGNENIQHARDKVDALKVALDNLQGEDCPTCKRPHDAVSSAEVEKQRDKLEDRLVAANKIYLNAPPLIPDLQEPTLTQKPTQPTRDQFFDHASLPLPPDQMALDEAFKEREDAKELRRRKDLAVTALATDVALLIERREQAVESNDRRAAIKATHDNAVEEARHWETVYELTSPRGVRQLMIDQSLDSVQAVANEILEILQPGTEVYFDTQTDTGRETLDLLLSTPDGVRTVASRSGGAGSRIATAIRCSLAMEAARSNGMPTLPFFILDEPFDSNDAAGKENLRLFLHWLSDRVGTVLVVSHDADILESIDTQIKLIKPAGETVVV